MTVQLQTYLYEIFDLYEYIKHLLDWNFWKIYKFIRVFIFTKIMFITNFSFKCLIIMFFLHFFLSVRLYL